MSAEQASGGPFSPAVALAATQPQGAGGSSGGGGLSRGKKAAAIAVPVIVGALLAACKILILYALPVKFVLCRATQRSVSKSGRKGVQPGASQQRPHGSRICCTGDCQGSSGCMVRAGQPCQTALPSCSALCCLTSCNAAYWA